MEVSGQNHAFAALHPS